MKKNSINNKDLIKKKIEYRHKNILFLGKNQEKNDTNMNDRDLRRFNKVSPKLDITQLSRDERRTGYIKQFNSYYIINKDFYERYINKKVGILIVNLNNLELTKNCINSIHKQININYQIYLFDQNSNEKNTVDFLDECRKNNINVYVNSENIPLNYIWNNFKDICDCEYLCFLNNDIIVGNTFIDDTIKILNNNNDVGAVIHVTNNPNYIKSENILNYKIFDTPRYQGWDFTIRRNLIPIIPKSLQIFGGDDYIFSKLNTDGHKIAIALSSPIIHFKEKTRINIPNIREIQNNDGLAFRKLILDENLKQAYSTLDDGTCFKYPPKNFELSQNENCVYTTIIGDYDPLYSKSYKKLENWDYICFTDNANLKSDFWRIVYIDNNNNTSLDDIKLARYFKTNSQKYLSSYKNILWIDARIAIIENLNEYLNYLNDNDIVLIEHPDAKSINEEFERVLHGKLEKPELIDVIKKRYNDLGYKYDNGLILSGVMLYKNNEKTFKFFNEWWCEIENFSHRDQLSANFVLWKNPELKYLLITLNDMKKYFKQLNRTKKRFTYE